MSIENKQSCKIKLNKENPIDLFLLNISNILNPYFYYSNHTPNTITTYSFIFGLLSCYFLYKGNTGLFALSFIISYFFDICDGNYARQYKMVTQFGDLYDHITDVTVFIILSSIIIVKYKNVISAFDIILFIISLYLMLIHLGCQQTNCKTCTGDETLDNLKILCKHKKHIYYTKYCGLGTFILIFILLIFNLDRKYKNNKRK